MRTTTLVTCIFTLFYSTAGLTQSVEPGKPSLKYKPSDLKKEVEDFKAFSKMVKEWNKGIKKPNPDYLNTLYGRILEKAYKEHNELSSRVSERSRQMHGNVKSNGLDSLNEEEKPKAFNPELKEQPARVSKEEIQQKKIESDYLSSYVKIVKSESSLLHQLKAMKSFTSSTEKGVLENVAGLLNDFQAKMQLELDLIKLETSKK